MSCVSAQNCRRQSLVSAYKLPRCVGTRGFLAVGVGCRIVRRSRSTGRAWGFLDRIFGSSFVCHLFKLCAKTRFIGFPTRRRNPGPISDTIDMICILLKKTDFWTKKRQLRPQLALRTLLTSSSHCSLFTRNLSTANYTKTTACRFLESSYCFNLLWRVQEQIAQEPPRTKHPDN